MGQVWGMENGKSLIDLAARMCCYTYWYLIRHTNYYTVYISYKLHQMGDQP